MKWAFSDESRRPGVMYVGLVVVETHAVVAARRTLHTLLMPGQRRLHLTDERAGRRSQILNAVSDLSVEALILRTPTSGTSIVRARRRLLAACVEELVARGVGRWTLDGVEAIQRDRDRADISAAVARLDADLLYDHEPSFAEPLLWAADAVTWASGSGSMAARALVERCSSRLVEP
jgi:hypothetical protein